MQKDTWIKYLVLSFVGLLSLSLSIAALAVALNKNEEQPTANLTTKTITDSWTRSLLKNSFLTTLTTKKLKSFYDAVGVGFDSAKGKKEFNVNKESLNFVHLAKSNGLNDALVKTFRQEPKVLTDDYLWTSGKGLKIGYEITIRKVQKAPKEGGSKSGTSSEVFVGTPIGFLVSRTTKPADEARTWSMTTLEKIKDLTPKKVTELSTTLKASIGKNLDEKDYQVFFSDYTGGAYYAIILNKKTGDLHFATEKRDVKLEAELKYVQPTPITE